MDDARNYYMGYLLAWRAGLKFITLNHANKDIPVEDRTVVGIHLIQSVSLNPERIRSQKRLVTARELVEMFRNQEL